MIKLLEIHPAELKLAVSEIKYKPFSYFYNYETSYRPWSTFMKESYCHCKEVYLMSRKGERELNKVVFFKKEPFLKAKALWDSFGFEDFEFVEALDQIAIEEKDNKLSSAKMDILITLVKSLDKDNEGDIYSMIDTNYGSKYPDAGSKYKFFIENKEKLNEIADQSFKRSNPEFVGLLTIYDENYGEIQA